MPVRRHGKWTSLPGLMGMENDAARVWQFLIKLNMQLPCNQHLKAILV